MRRLKPKRLSASGGLRPHPLTRGCAPGPRSGLRPRPPLSARAPALAISWCPPKICPGPRWPPFLAPALFLLEWILQFGYCSLMLLCMFLMFFIKVEKNVFLMFFISKLMFLTSIPAACSVPYRDEFQTQPRFFCVFGKIGIVYQNCDT